MAVEWRLLQPSDVGGANKLSRIAGWNQTERDWAGYLAFEPNGCFAAIMDGQLAGTATTIRYGSALGWIGMVLVHPRFRRLGIGTQLLERSIRYLAECGIKGICLDATPMGRPVYLLLGFNDVSEISRLEGPDPSVLGDGAMLPAGVRLSHISPEDHGPIADFDAETFGVRRVQVLESLGRRNPEYCFVARDARGVVGYMIARLGREAVQAGPGVAGDPLVAASLFSSIVKAAAGRRVFLDVPSAHHSAMAMAGKMGFRTQRVFMRMVLGEALPRGRPEWVVATSGAEKG